MRIASPLFLLLLLVPLVVLYGRWARRRRPPAERLAFPGVALARKAGSTLRASWHALPATLGLLGLTLLILGLARPQLPGDADPTRVRSRNIMVILDISSSMKATDFKPGNRLAVAKQVLRDFVRGRQGDLMGLVVFSSRAFIQAPLTTDTEVLDRLIDQVDIGMLPDGTAIGTAMALGLSQLKNLPNKASVVVLITDGANNTGEPTPRQAAEAAKALGIRIHTIGVSSADTSLIALNGVWSLRTLSGRLSTRDEAALKDIAARTGGQYYKATDPDMLKAVMQEIDPMERIEVKVAETRRYHELFPWFVSLGLAMLLAELLLGATWLRRLP
jgi:Ca-activated chloride channel family protein